MYLQYMLNKLEIQEIIKSRGQNTSYAKIAEKVGHSISTVVKICSEHKDEIEKMISSEKKNMTDVEQATVEDKIPPVSETIPSASDFEPLPPEQHPIFEQSPPSQFSEHPISGPPENLSLDEISQLKSMLNKQSAPRNNYAEYHPPQLSRHAQWLKGFLLQAGCQRGFVDTYCQRVSYDNFLPSADDLYSALKFSSSGVKNDFDLKNVIINYENSKPFENEQFNQTRRSHDPKYNGRDYQQQQWQQPQPQMSNRDMSRLDMLEFELRKAQTERFERLEQAILNRSDVDPEKQALMAEIAEMRNRNQENMTNRLSFVENSLRDSQIRNQELSQQVYNKELSGNDVKMASLKNSHDLDVKKFESEQDFKGELVKIGSSLVGAIPQVLENIPKPGSPQMMQQKCPSCGQTITYPEGNKKVTCPGCRSEFVIESISPPEQPQGTADIPIEDTPSMSEVPCPGCGTMLQFPAELEGQIQCPKCGHQSRILEKSDAPIEPEIQVEPEQSFKPESQMPPLYIKPSKKPKSSKPRKKPDVKKQPPAETNKREKKESDTNDKEVEKDVK